MRNVGMYRAARNQSDEPHTICVYLQTPESDLEVARCYRFGDAALIAKLLNDHVADTKTEKEEIK
jgi:hypothetical protein